LTRTGHLDPATVFQVKAQQLRKSGLLSLHRGSESFDQLGGLSCLKHFCLQALRPGPVRAKGVLLLGPPGTGKSAFAKSLGRETNRPVLELDIGALYGSLVGQTEANIRTALRVAEAMAPCVLLVDEIEKALSGIGGNGDSGTATRLFGTLLTWLNDHQSQVFFVCTANDVSKLPPEFTRAGRFDATFYLDFPTISDRERIWQICLRQHDIQPQPRPDDHQWTGSEIASCCRLSVLLGLPLVEAGKLILPVANTAREKLEALAQWASGRTLSASLPGPQGGAAPVPTPPRRMRNARPGLN
jgi:SpoVK/Ycf46/Vps4 family AAA+-type ATPase